MPITGEFEDSLSISNTPAPAEKPLADTELPSFGTNWTLSTGYTSDNFDFVINVTDNVWVNNVTVNFTWAGAGQWYNMSMTNISGNWTYTHLMPTFNTTVTYFFSANDSSDNWNNTGFGYAEILDNDSPNPLSGSGNFTVGTGNGFVIYANFTDNVGVKNATLYYRKVTDVVYSSSEMNEGNEGEFSLINQFIIETATDDTDWLYYVIAFDAMGNPANYTYNETNSLPWRINVTDDDAPTFVSGSGNFSVKVGFGFTIYANFTDNLGAENVSSVVIYYKKETAGSYNPMPMQKVGSGNYSITNVSLGIDTSADDTDCLYYLWANDTLNNNATHPPTYDFKITIVDTTFPNATNGSGDIIAFCSTGFTIYANFTDNINVTSAKVFWAYEFNSTHFEVNMTESLTEDDHFYVNNVTMGVNIYNNTKALTYYAIGYDNEGNPAKYNDTGDSDWNITVVDDVAPSVINGSGDFTTTTSLPFTIHVNFSDNINVSRAVIYFKRPTNSSYFTFNMTWTGLPGYFIATQDNLTEACDMDPAFCIDPIYYYILAYDPNNNSGNHSKTEGVDWKITINDDIGPELLNCTKSFVSTTGEPFIIYANFTDNINISHANFFYKRKSSTGDATEYKEKPMNKTLGLKGNFFINSYVLAINTYTDARDILYYFVAFDSFGNWIRAPFDQFDSYKITINDNDRPWLVSGSKNITIGTGDDFTLYGNFSDNIEVDKVHIYFKKETWSVWEYIELEEDDEDEDKVWEFRVTSLELDVTIDTSKDDSDYYYYFKVFDSKSPTPNIFDYTYGSVGFKITVLDDDAPTSAKNKGSGSFKTTTGEVFIIYANFTDNIKVDHARIYIRNQSITSTWPVIINMTESTRKAGQFYVYNSDLSINTTSDDSDYEYYVVCFDTANNSYIYDYDGEPFSIDVIDNDNPIARAGVNQVVEEGTTVYLNAKGSTDNIGIKSYTWTFTYQKIEKVLTGAKVEFTFEYHDNYNNDHNIWLTVIDEQGNIGLDDLYVNITKKNVPPTIEAVKPENDEFIYVFAVLESEIYVRFSESIEINEDNINELDFFFMNDSAGQTINGTFSWSEYSYKLFFDPSSELKYDERYTITVTTAVKDKTGKHLQSPKTWSFSTYPEDSDEDSLPDWWEVEKVGGWITQIGPSDDPDKDEFTNLQEYNAGTDPMDFEDHPPVKEEGKEEALNLLLYSVLAIIVILVLIILIVGIMIYRKRKAEEEEERRKPTPIEHEILFDEGGGALGPVPEPAPESTRRTPTGATGEPETPDSVELEPALETPEAEGPLAEPEETVEPELGLGEGEEEGEMPIESEPEDLEEDEETEVETAGAEEEQDLAVDDTDLDLGADEDVQLYIDSGNDQFEAGNYSDAIIEWQKALDIDPDQPELQAKMKEAMEKMTE